jgi:hypothetical protein
MFLGQSVYVLGPLQLEFQNMEDHEPVDWGDPGVIILCEPLL